MACTSYSLAGLNGSCDPSKGGIVEVMVALYQEDAATVGTANTVSSFATGITWYGYAFKKGTGSMTSTLNVDPANGVNYVSTDLVLQFTKMDTAKRLEMKALSLDDLMVIVKDANGTYWFLGKDEPVQASAGTGQTGQNRSDGNFYQITLQANDDTFPIQVDKAAVPEPTYPNA